MVDVCLVQMPYVGIHTPSMALGLLHAYLSAAGIAAKSIYANIMLAEAIGIDVYKTVEDTPPDTLVGDWTFARVAFPESRSDDAAFLAQARPRLADDHWLEILHRLHPRLDEDRLLREVRDRMPAFVEQVVNAVLALQPRIVGCTSTYQQHCASLALLRRIKALRPDVITMLGGANCEGVMGEATHRHFAWVDLVFTGEVDDFIAPFCRNLLDLGLEKATRTLPEGVFGPPHRLPGRCRIEPRRPFLSSLDKLAVPDYDDYFEAIQTSSFATHVRPALVFESSRGCWWGQKHQCVFCGLNGDRLTFRAKPPERVLDEILTLSRRYRVRWMNAVDVIMDPRHMRTVLPALADSDARPFLFYEVKANLKRDQVKLLGAAGVRRIQPGIESLHDDVLKLLGKGCSWHINLQLLKWAQEFGITVFWNFLSGVRGERGAWYTELAEWLPLISHLEPPGSSRRDSHLTGIRYDRFSPYFNAAERYGISLVARPGYRAVYPLPPEAIDDLAYFFEDENDAGLIGRPGHLPEHEAVEQRLSEWHEAFRGGSPDATPARLIIEHHGDHAVVLDTRPVAVSPEMKLYDLDYAVVRACETAQTFDGLVGALQHSEQQAPGAADVRTAVDRLNASKLVLEWRGRILSLPVNAPVTPYLPPTECPGVGDVGPLIRDLTRTGLARHCLRPPDETPLSALFSETG